MSEHLDGEARRSVVLAREAARALGQGTAGPGHLLHDGAGTAARALAGERISLLQARREVEQAAGRAPQARHGHIPLSPQAETVLEHARQTAAELGTG
jgi:hypothetical protein